MQKILRNNVQTVVTACILIVAVIGVTIIQNGIINFLTTYRQDTIESVAHIQRDLQYCDTTDISQSLDLFLPRSSRSSSTPLLIYVHGGGWNEGDKNNLIEQEYSVELAKRGIAVASVDYRLSNEATYPAQIEDVSCAAEYMTKNAARFNIDTEQMIIMGDSAGGHLAAMESLSNKRSYDGVVMAYGVSDLWKQITQYNDTNAIRLLGEKREELANKASPQFISLVDKPQFLLIHGAIDTIVPMAESEDFAAKLRSAGAVVSYIPISNAGHGFLGTNDDHDKEAKQAILKFIDELLKK